MRTINYKAIELDSISTSVTNGAKTDLTTAINNFEKYEGLNFSKSSIKIMLDQRSHYNEFIFGSLIFNFTPVKPERISTDSFYSSKGFLKGFKVNLKEIDYKFCDYVLGNMNYMINQNIWSDTKISDMYNLIKFMT